MALKNTRWLADQLGLSLSTVERLRKEAPDTLPPHITIQNSIRYEERIVEWWIIKQSNPLTPDFIRWCKEQAGTIDKPIIKFVTKTLTGDKK